VKVQVLLRSGHMTCEDSAEVSERDTYILVTATLDDGSRRVTQIPNDAIAWIETTMSAEEWVAEKVRLSDERRERIERLRGMMGAPA